METFNVSQCLPIAGADPASLQLTRPQRLSVGKLSCSVNVMVKTKVLEHFQMPRSWSMKKSGLVNTYTISWDPGNLCIQTQVFIRNYWRMGKMEDEGETETQYQNQFLGLARAIKGKPHTVTLTCMCAPRLRRHSVRIFSGLIFTKQG